MTEGITIGRAVANELDAAKFDPLLSKAVAKGMVTSLEHMISRWSNLVSFTINEMDFGGLRLSVSLYIGCMGPDCCIVERTDCHPSAGIERSAGFVSIPMLVSTHQAGR